jgi:hypothetical protein
MSWELKRIAMGTPLTYATIGDDCCQALALKDAWGAWLTDLGDHAGGWDWWVSLTFRDFERQGTWTRPGWAFTSSAWDKWLLYIREMQFQSCPLDDLPHRKPITWVRCREQQKGRGIDHFHALLAGVLDLRRDAAWSFWFRKYGIARILPYNRNLGAGYYLCKYVTKELGDIQFSDDLTKA